MNSTLSTVLLSLILPAALTAAPPMEVTVETIRAAADMGGDGFPPVLLRIAAGADQTLRQAALEALTSRPAWAAKLLDALEAKDAKVKTASVPVTVRRYFATAAPDDLKKRAAAVLGKWNESGDNVKKLIAAKRKACMEGEPDLVQGKLMFTATCAVCHKFHGGGQEVGPELIGSGRSSLDALLNNVIDPNQIIGSGYENVIINTKDGRTIAGRIIEDTPNQVTLLGTGGLREVVSREKIAKQEITGNSLMPMSFGELPDDVFRNLVWYVLAPPEEGPLTKEKRAALSAPVTAEAAPPKPGGDGVPRGAKVDGESVSLWNPDWKVMAPEFEGTPCKLPEYLGRKNVLMLHPFDDDRNKPAKLTREMTLPADKPVKLKFSAASHKDGDWQLLVSVNGKEVKRRTIGHDGDAWKNEELDLGAWKGQKVTLSLENHATDWMYEFSYWADLRVE